MQKTGTKTSRVKCWFKEARSDDANLYIIEKKRCEMKRCQFGFLHNPVNCVCACMHLFLIFL